MLSRLVLLWNRGSSLKSSTTRQAECRRRFPMRLSSALIFPCVLTSSLSFSSVSSSHVSNMTSSWPQSVLST